MLSEITLCNPKIESMGSILFCTDCDGWNRELFQARCENQLSSLLIIQTNTDVIIGFYIPDYWVDTTIRDDSWKIIDNGKSLVFYTSGQELKVCKQKDACFMFSTNDYFLGVNEVCIENNRKKKDVACLQQDYYLFPEDVGKAKFDNESGYLYIAQEENEWFTAK